MLRLRLGDVDPHAPSRSRDFLSRPISTFSWWGIPLLAGISTNVLPIAPIAGTIIWVVAMAWMGVGCTLNARRCHRLHCYISAPLLFLGAVGAGMVGLGFTPWRPDAASAVINVSLALALATILVEPIWGKYRSP